MNSKYLFPCWLIPLILTACGGGGTNSNMGNGNYPQTCTPTPPNITLTTNQVLIAVEQMPALNGSESTINIPYTTVTVCNPNTAQCIAVPHVLVDTGSYGLRILDSALTGLNLPNVRSTSSNTPLYECAYFINNFTFGAIVSGNITLGNLSTTTPTSFQLIDTTGNNGPCNTSGSFNSGSQQALGANGIIGIGNLTDDSSGANYYTSQSPTSSWQLTATPSTNSSGLVVNPVLQFSSPNNNGTLMTMLPVSQSACSAYGTLSMGLGSNNLSGLTMIGTDQYGQINATVPTPGLYPGTTLTGSFVDSGSNEIFVDLTLKQSNFGNNSSPNYLYQPSNPTPISFTLSNPNNSAQSFQSSFTVTDPTSAFNNNFNAIPGYAGPENAKALDLGFPYFYGHSIAYLIAGQTASSYTGPMVGIQ